jgi:hypothetical protein
VLHRRTLDLGGTPPVLVVTDEVLAAGDHGVEIRFHVADDAHVKMIGERTAEIAVPGGMARLVFDDALSVGRLEGRVDPIEGWVSRGYHRRAASTTLVGRARTSGPRRFVCRVEVH